MGHYCDRAVMAADHSMTSSQGVNAVIGIGIVVLAVAGFAAVVLSGRRR